jgi:hypothetical protein
MTGDDMAQLNVGRAVAPLDGRYWGGGSWETSTLSS